MSIKLISKHRTCLMALAMIWIGFNHSNFPFQSKIVNFFILCGYCGVDIFIFLSGFGLYYALKKEPTYKEYIKRYFLGDDYQYDMASGKLTFDDMIKKCSFLKKGKYVDKDGKNHWKKIR